jgi:hypothetical protein
MAKDWTGNSVSVYKNLGASNHCDEERENNDYYATPPIATKCLIKYFGEHLNKDVTILEPCCGEGHIAKEFCERGYNVISQDLIDRGYGTPGIDFLTCDFDSGNFNIITNPPYKYAREFVEKSMKIVDDDRYVIMLLKLTFLETVKRLEMFKKYPPKYVLIFSDRINCAKNGDFDNEPENGGAVCYCWYIWQKGFNGKPTIDWLNTSEYVKRKDTNSLF